MQRFVILSGPNGCGKHRYARYLCKRDGLVLVSRDAIRAALFTKIDEWEITILLGTLAAELLTRGHGVVVAANNLLPEDRVLWAGVSASVGVQMAWLFVPNLVLPDDE